MRLPGGLSNLFTSLFDAIGHDLKRLNAVKAGLRDQAAAYVRSGDGGAVLSSLNALCGSDPLQVCRQWVGDHSPTLARRKLLARSDPYDLDVMQRYAEVLCAAAPAAPAGAGAQAHVSGSSLAGSDRAPRLVRIFFTEAFLGLPERLNSWPRKAERLNGKGLTLERAIEMTRRLGGDVVDFFDVLYAQEDASRYSGTSGSLYRQAVDVRTAVEAHPDALLSAAGRMPAPARTELLNDLTTWAAARTGAFVGFLVAQAGASSKGVREAAISALACAPVETIEPVAIRLLHEGDADQRTGMVDLLARLGGQAALHALKAHREAEKTARIVAAVDTALALVARRSAPADGDDDTGGYAALDGRRIDVPSVRPLDEREAPTFGEADRDALRTAILQQNERSRKYNEENERRAHFYRAPMISEQLADEAVRYLNGEPSNKARNDLVQFLCGTGQGWTRSALSKMPDSRALQFVRALRRGGYFQNLLIGQQSQRTLDYLAGSNGDLRSVEALDIEAGVAFEHGDWDKRRSRQMRAGDYLRRVLSERYDHMFDILANLPRQALWPYMAENLDVFDEALGLKPIGEVKLDRPTAVRALALLPATPARYFAPLLEVATGETKDGRAEARALLRDAPEVEQRLVALLDDSRQAIRAGAAEWLSIRRDASAVSALERRLGKEKSELARAAILTALKRLGEDLSSVLGPKALVAEAKKGLKSAKFDKLAWLKLENLPRSRFRDGSTVPAEVLRWWVFLAFKLKQPGGNALFQIYLDQLEPKDAETFSAWILESWLAHDTTRPSDADANAHAKAHAAGRFQSSQRWMKDYTEDRAFADLKHEFLSQYLNSGAESKGVLGLAVRASAAVVAERVRAYLKNHGQRTSQASALLETLAGIGDPVALQVVIAAATRLKQKGVQKFAGELINQVAEARDWTMDELADRTIPTAGFDDDGVLALPCGEDPKAYEARLSANLGVVLRNPAGKEVAGLPAGQDEATAASKKQLAATKKELKQIVSMQSARLYEALCAERAWTADDWMRHFHGHPVMRRLVERVVWLGLDEAAQVAGVFRPTAEGDFTDAADSAVDVRAYAHVRVAHGALLDDAQAKAWGQHLADYEVKPLFAQFGRELLRIEPKDADKTAIEDRKDWVTDAFTLRGAASKLGYERGGALDGGFFTEYLKPFKSARVTAIVEFSGNSLPEENVAAALYSLSFVKDSGSQHFRVEMKLGEVPPVLLSECWNDYRAMAAKAQHDPEWGKKSPW